MATIDKIIRSVIIKDSEGNTVSTVHIGTEAELVIFDDSVGDSNDTSYAGKTLDPMLERKLTEKANIEYYGNTEINKGRKNDSSKAWGSDALGKDTIASGQFSFVAGLATSALATAAHAEGENTIASKRWSHAEGFNTQANGECSHVEGLSTITESTAAHAGGDSSIASHECSFVHGKGLQTSRRNQMVIGCYNSIENAGQALFIIGNGTTNEDRKNAFIIDADNNAYISGSLIVDTIKSNNENEYLTVPHILANLQDKALVLSSVDSIP